MASAHRRAAAPAADAGLPRPTGMTQTDTLAAETAPAPSPRVEGWVGYYEYFHSLNEDMQASSARSAALCFAACLEYASCISRTPDFRALTVRRLVRSGYPTPAARDAPGPAQWQTCHRSRSARAAASRRSPRRSRRTISHLCTSRIRRMAQRCAPDTLTAPPPPPPPL